MSKKMCSKGGRSYRSQLLFGAALALSLLVTPSTASAQSADVRGFFYEVDTGNILSGIAEVVMGSAPGLSFIEFLTDGLGNLLDGNLTGEYAFTASGTNGNYQIGVSLLDDSYVMAEEFDLGCIPVAGALDLTTTNTQVIGSTPNIGLTALTSGACVDNPWYSLFDIDTTLEHAVTANNIALRRISRDARIINTSVLPVAPLEPGDSYTLSFEIMNEGDVQIEDPEIFVYLPASTTVNLASSNFSGIETWSCGISPFGNTCAILPANLPTGTTYTANLVLSIDSDFATDTLAIEAEVITPATDTDLTDNDFILDLDVLLPDPGTVDLSITLNPTVAPLSPNSLGSIMITYRNLGTATATDIIIETTIANGFTFNEASGTSGVWSCPDNSPAGTNCQFSTPNLGPGAVGVVYLGIQSGATVLSSDFSANIEATETETDTANNTAMTTLSIYVTPTGGEGAGGGSTPPEETPVPRSGGSTFFVNLAPIPEIPPTSPTENPENPPEIIEEIICAERCEDLDFEVYIINPDGTERRGKSSFAKIETLTDGSLVFRFEDSDDIDTDYNDVVIKIQKNCADKSVRAEVLSVSASWKHRVRLSIRLDGVERLNRELFADSHTGRLVGPKTYSLQNLLNQCQNNEIGGQPDILGSNNWCQEEYLTEPVSRRVRASTQTVMRLQSFLNFFGYDEVTISGSFDLPTENAVRDFQEAYALEILRPLGLRRGTGGALAYTRRQINSMMCDLSK